MTFAPRYSALALVASAALLLTSCDSKSTAPAKKTLTAITLAPSTASIAIGATQALTVTAAYSDATTATLSTGVTFASSSSAIASVGTTGTVSGVAPGTATITATETASAKTATASITVLAPTLTSIAISPPTASLVAGATQALTVTGTYSDASTRALTSGVTFTSSVLSVATVNTAGLVTAVAAGTATITATETASSKTATSAITVTAPVPTLASIALSPNAINLAPGATQALTVTGTYSDASTANLTAGSTFLSSATSVATVTAGGLVSAVAVGSATITATNTASGKTANVTVTVVTVGVGAVVFSDGYDAGVSFVDFGGADNAVTIDAATVNNGHKSLKAVITATGGYSGGAFLSAAPRNLSAYNALTFWAKANTARATLKVGIGNNGTTNLWNAESIGIPLTTTFTKFIIPLPDKSKMVGVDGLFHFADGPNNYTVWFNDVQYENLSAAQVAAPTGATANWPATTVAVGSTAQLGSAPNTVAFTTPVLPNAGRLTDVAWRWYTLTSSNTAVATVNADGRVSAVSAGTANISATMAGIVVAASALITVTAPLAIPSTIAATPVVAAANVISLFSTAYTNRAVDTWRTGWSTCCNELVDPYVIAAHNVKQYTLHSFAGVEFGIATPANTIDATTMTTFHVDVWTPNPSANLEIQLVNDAAGTAAIGKYQAGALAAGTWVSLEIPLASFAGLTSRVKLQQLLFVAAGPSVLYVDNIYLHK